MWQNTVIGTLGTLGKDYFTRGTQPGIKGNCDLNVCYRDYPAIMQRTGLNGFGQGVTKPEEAPDIGIPTTGRSITVKELCEIGYKWIIL